MFYVILRIFIYLTVMGFIAYARERHLLSSEHHNAFFSEYCQKHVFKTFDFHTLPSPAISTSAVWCRDFHSRVFHSRVFSVPVTKPSLAITRLRMLHFTSHNRHHSQEIDDFDVVLFQIYRGIRFLIITAIQKDLKELLQK